MAKKTIFSERMDLRLTPEHRKALAEIAKHLGTTESEAIRVCIFDYWEKI